MKSRALNILLILLAIVLTSGCAFAAKAKPKPKPKPKPAQTTHHETVGTSQLQGGFGLIGHSYTLGKESPWNMQLSSAEYSVETIAIGDTIVFPTRDEKLLVLHYTVHNPQKGEALMRFDSFAITAVDAKDKNWEFNGDLGNELTRAKFDQMMKPAQKANVFVVVRVPAAGEVPKVIFKSSDQLVIRYDLRGKVKGLPAPYADPSDSTGATARAVVPAEFGVFYPTGQLAVNIEKTSFADGAIGEMDPGEDNRLFVIAMTAKNLDKIPALLRFDTLSVQLKDADGVEINATQDTYRASSDKSLSVNVDPDKEIKFRLVMSIEKGIEPKTITLGNSNGDGRQFEFQIK